MLGTAINDMINKQDLSLNMTRQLFQRIINDQDSAMEQGAFLAALTAKGATEDEIIAIRDIIYESDTNKVTINTPLPLVENSGTGMDAFKTFNISTGASIIAAACGVAIARHCSRAITSKCGAVDVAEALGIDVEADSIAVGRSVEQCGMGMFNGMSTKIHPFRLSRILSQISFGTVLNTAASLANPAAPLYGVRGVNTPDKIIPTAKIMKKIGYRRCMVIHGMIGEDTPAMDEASTMGKTLYTFIDENGRTESGSFYPEDFGIKRPDPDFLAGYGEPTAEAGRLIQVLKGKGSGACQDIIRLNAALILYTTGISSSMMEAFDQTGTVIENGEAFKKLEAWVCHQSSPLVDNPMEKLNSLQKSAL